MRRQRQMGWVLTAVLMALLAFPSSAAATPEADILTLTQLQQRLAQPVRIEGQQTVDLRQIQLDLRDPDFRTAFYQQTQAALQVGSEPLNLALDEAVILGEFNLAALGLRSPLLGDGLSGLFTDAAQLQLVQDRQRAEASATTQSISVFRGSLSLSNATITGQLRAENTYFLGDVTAGRAIFAQPAEATGVRFLRNASFAGAQFRQAAKFDEAVFWGPAQFSAAQFGDTAQFEAADFRAVGRFDNARFAQAASFRLTHWLETAHFDHSQFAQPVSFAKAQFGGALALTAAELNGAIFRQTQFAQPVELRGAALQQRIEFGDASFAPGATLNVAELEFSAQTAQIVGTPGQLGQQFQVPTLAGNEAVLKNLVRNFRQLEQIADANQIEYTTERLRLQQLGQKLHDPLGGGVWGQVGTGLRWLSLDLLLLLSRYGTSAALVLGIGLGAIAPFALIYGWLDQSPTLAGPTAATAGLSLAGLALICTSADAPGVTLACLGLLVVPSLLGARIRRSGSDELSYFTQDGSARQLRLLIARLPVIPSFPFFRDRYTALVRSRRWNWLNYFDFSVNNLLRFGFNDTRLRDIAVPAGLSGLVWYQWALGVLYIALLLWTLSRTIPGLNLLLYF